MTYRLLPAEGKLFKSQVAGTLIGGLVLALLLSAAPGAAPSADVVVAGALLYLVFCYVYFHWNNMGETARRIRMLRELGRSVPEPETGTGGAEPGSLSFGNVALRSLAGSRADLDDVSFSVGRGEIVAVYRP